jgi:CHAD domain-containing protein
VATVHEVEDKYTVGSGFEVPDLGRLDGISAMTEPHTVELAAVYFDTSDYRLVRNGVTLRRRTGGEDAGWHLKLPVDKARDEVQRPLGRGQKVPPELAELVTARSRGAVLKPVARLQTHRTLRRVLGPDDVVLAEVADDEVRAQLLDGETQLEESVWREVEVELVDGDSGLLRTIGRGLRRAGARPAKSGSKIAYLLGDRLAAGPDLPEPAGSGPKTPSREVVRGYLTQHVNAMLAADPRVRLDEPDAVHKMRVASRRIRSTLRSFSTLLDAERAADLGERLRGLSGELGVPRDREVQLQRLLEEVSDQPDALVHGPVRRRLEERLGGERLRGHDAVLKLLRGSGYAELLDDLLDFVHTGVRTDGPARRPAKDVLPRLLRKRYRRLAHRIALAQEADGSERDAALHSAQKAAKRLRYAAEALSPAFGKDAAVLASRTEDVQEVLGEHQDSVVAQALLRDLSLAAHEAPDESSFTFGLLIGLEQTRARDARADLEDVWRRLSRKRHRRWLG